MIRFFKSALFALMMMTAATLSASGEKRAMVADARLDEARIRAAYNRMSMYSEASYLHSMRGENEWLAANLALRFDLRDFRRGQFADIMGARWMDMVSEPAGEIIRGAMETIQGDGGEQFAYAAEWAADGYSTVLEPSTTVADVMRVEGERLGDVGHYISYEVTASLDGRSRTYRAMVVFHDRFDPDNRRMDFLDNVAGTTGQVTQLSQEGRQPFRRFPADSNSGLATSEAGSSPRLRVRADAYTGVGVVASKTWHPEGTEEHASGSHEAYAELTITCSEAFEGHHSCDADGFPSSADTGVVHLPFRHRVTVSRASSSKTVPSKMQAPCAIAVAMGVQSCVFLCNAAISVGLSGDGFQAQANISGNQGMIFSDQEILGGVCAANTIAKTDPGDDDGICSEEELTFSGDDCGTPVLIDVDGDGYQLTDAAHGVRFDLNADGASHQMAWTAGDSDEAFLVLDRDGNGAIDNGRELFGDFTQQPASAARNGFLALAVFDMPADGGNADGVVDVRDAVFPLLRLWRDQNHDGISQPDELTPLASADIQALQLRYHESRKTDEYGNRFLYRARLTSANHADVAKTAWDVVFRPLLP